VLILRNKDLTLSLGGFILAAEGITMVLHPARAVMRQFRLSGKGLALAQVRMISTSPILTPETPSSPPPAPATQPLSTVEPLQGISIPSEGQLDGFNVIEPKFEVVGNVCSLLNVSMPASWPLYTRRGTLVSVRGNIENVFDPINSH